MTILRKIINGYGNLMNNYSDPRTKDLFMMDSPFPTIAISFFYIFCVKVLGPRLMAHRKPLIHARTIQLLYNSAHLLINVYLLREAIACGWLSFYSFTCQPVDFSNSVLALRAVRACHLYYLSKFTDFFETVTFVMLKRFDMVNLYHVAHHSIMPISVWWGVKFLPGGHSTFFGFINTFVHVVIYTYFLTITLFPATRRIFFWWKTFYPFFQISQFLLIFVHAFQLLWKNECNYPIAFVYFIGGHAVLFYILVMQKMKMDKQGSFNKVQNSSPKPKAAELKCHITSDLDELNRRDEKLIETARKRLARAVK